MNMPICEIFTDFDYSFQMGAILVLFFDLLSCPNLILSYFFGKILFCPIFWEMSYFILFFGHFAFNFVVFLSPLLHIRTFVEIF